MGDNVSTINEWSDIQKKITEDKIVKEIFKSVLTTHSRSEKLAIGNLTISGVALGLLISNLEQLNNFYEEETIKFTLILVLASSVVGFVSVFYGFLSYIYMQVDSYLSAKILEILSELEKEQVSFEKNTGVFPEIGVDWSRVLAEFHSVQPWWLKWRNFNKYYTKGLKDSNFVIKKSVKNYQRHTIFLAIQVLLLLLSVIFLIKGL